MEQVRDTSVPVDVVVNCFERTYQSVLAPGFFEGITSDNAVRFESRTVVINNVDDRSAATVLARERLAAGEIDRWVFVEDYVDAAYAALDLMPEDLGDAPWFTEWALVAVTLPGPEFVLLWDADVRLTRPTDWLNPAIDLLRADPSVLVANPAAHNETHLAEQWTFARTESFDLSYGCSDQIVLGRRSELGSPIYGERTLSRLRFPLAHTTYIFEARIDSYMRRHDRARATYRGVTYEHRQEARVSYPAVPAKERVRRFADQALLWLLRRSPILPRHLRHL